ncbi:hypothetical protein D3C75_762600 [compost metagenome]
MVDPLVHRAGKSLGQLGGRNPALPGTQLQFGGTEAELEVIHHQAAFSAAYLQGKGAEPAGETRFHHGQSSVRIMQGDHRIVLHVPAGNKAELGADSLRHTQVIVGQVHRMAAQIDQRTAAALFLVVEMGRKPAFG